MNIFGTMNYSLDKKVKSETSYTLVESSGLSRIWQYTHNGVNFAIIGTQDKDTKENRKRELLFELEKLSDKNNKINWKVLHGNYTYDDGSTGVETSFLINNISKDDALRIMRKINQESIIWKDDSFFGFLDATGNEDGNLSRGDKNMSFNSKDVAAFGSRLNSKHNKGQGFTFKLESMTPVITNYSSVDNLRGDNSILHEDLFTLKASVL